MGRVGEVPASHASIAVLSSRPLWGPQHELHDWISVRVKWLHMHERKISMNALDVAARKSQIHVLRYLYEHSNKRCALVALRHAAWRGFVDIVKLVVENQKKKPSHHAAIIAAALLSTVSWR